jgi:hypothetical protein
MMRFQVCLGICVCSSLQPLCRNAHTPGKTLIRKCFESLPQYGCLSKAPPANKLGTTAQRVARRDMQHHEAELQGIEHAFGACQVDRVVMNRIRWILDTTEP